MLCQGGKHNAGESIMPAQAANASSQRQERRRRVHGPGLAAAASANSGDTECSARHWRLQPMPAAVAQNAGPGMGSRQLTVKA